MANSEKFSWNTSNRRILGRWFIWTNIDYNWRDHLWRSFNDFISSRIWITDEYEEIDGDKWEEIIKVYIEENEPELNKEIHGDSESSTCVLWTNNEIKFKRLLLRIIELLENELEVNRIVNELASR